MSPIVEQGAFVVKARMNGFQSGVSCPGGRGGSGDALRNQATVGVLKFCSSGQARLGESLALQGMGSRRRRAPNGCLFLSALSWFKFPRQISRAG